MASACKTASLGAVYEQQTVVVMAACLRYAKLAVRRAGKEQTQVEICFGASERNSHIMDGSYGSSRSVIIYTVDGRHT